MSTVTKTPTVFVIEPCPKPINSAEKYGEILYLFDFGERGSIWQTVELSEEILFRLEQRGYDNVTDYILITGNIITLAIMCAAVGAVYGEFQALLFDAKDGTYTLRTLGVAE